VSKPDLSIAIQDYLKEIYKLQSSGQRATTTAIARAMGVAPSSATSMLKKLAALGLAEHAPYRGVELSEAGTKIALEVIRHHRLLEQYLAETLGLGIDAVHAEADRLEHALSETLEERIDRALGSPTEDPHGDPIPSPALKIVHSKGRNLTDLEPGDEATVQGVPDRDGEVLRYLSELGLVPGRRVELVRAEPFGGPLTLRADGKDAAIARDLAAEIRIA
jgi:DtxR family Mn-dependent transcriptional regulator